MQRRGEAGPSGQSGRRRARAEAWGKAAAPDLSGDEGRRRSSTEGSGVAVAGVSPARPVAGGEEHRGCGDAQGCAAAVARGEGRGGHGRRRRCCWFGRAPARVAGACGRTREARRRSHGGGRRRRSGRPWRGAPSLLYPNTHTHRGKIREEGEIKREEWKEKEREEAGTGSGAATPVAGDVLE